MKQQMRTQKKHITLTSNKQDKKRRGTFTYKLVLEYEGTRYQGWQVQRDVRTVQGILLGALENVFPGDVVETGGAGRTDKGVHALAQVAHVRIGSNVPPDILKFKLNDALPYDIIVKTAESAPNSFHARYNAVARSYVYQIALRKTALWKNLVWWIKDELNFSAMHQVAEQCAGVHDFSRFADIRSEKESTRVRVFSASLQKQEDLLIFHICADHFLWKMVRKIVGVMVEAGRGKLAPSLMSELLNLQAEYPAIPTPPPSGLFLQQVYYQPPEDLTEKNYGFIRLS
jgi:tRNA pseudouridine38-40 synthase